MQQEIKKYYPDKHEEFITEFFHGRFATALEAASNEQRISQAFLKNLKSAYPDVQNYDLQKIANGLVAEATLHEKLTEKKTGGDMGLMIVRPQIIKNDEYIKKMGDYRRGVLCQAKMKNKDGKWGSFTKQQNLLLPDRMSYLCLLLYSYKDSGRRELNNYQWYICQKDETLEQVAGYIKKDQFHRFVESDVLIQAIGRGLIGTDDDAILDEIITSKKNPSLTIRLFWSYGNWRDPGTSIHVYSTQENMARYSSQINLRH